MEKHLDNWIGSSELLNTNEVISDYEFSYKVFIMQERFDFERDNEHNRFSNCA